MKYIRFATQAAFITLFALGMTSLAGGCQELIDSAEKTIDGKAAELKEKDLPNCSRMLTCCANLTARNGMPQSVKDGCGSLTPSVTKVIDTYQSGQKSIADNTTTTQQSKEKAANELRSTSQGTLEPACRCLLEETLGKVSLDGFLTPTDCETVKESGALPAGKKCSDVTDVVTSAK